MNLQTYLHQVTRKAKLLLLKVRKVRKTQLPKLLMRFKVRLSLQKGKERVKIKRLIQSLKLYQNKRHPREKGGKDPRKLNLCKNLQLQNYQSQNYQKLKVRRVRKLL